MCLKGLPNLVSVFRNGLLVESAYMQLIYMQAIVMFDHIN